MGQRIQVDATLGDRFGMGASLGTNDSWFPEVRCCSGRLSKLGGEFTEREVLTALLDEPERRDVPEHRGTAVPEQYLPPVGQCEQCAELRANVADEVLDGRLAMRSAEHRVAGGHDSIDLLVTDLRRPAPEPPVRWQQLGGNGDGGGIRTHPTSMASHCRHSPPHSETQD